MATSNTKKTGARFNIFDVLIILAVLACIAAIGVRAYFLATTEEQMQTARVEFVVKNVSDVTAEAFSKQYSTLYLASTDKEIGTIINAYYSAAVIDAEIADGTIVRAFHPDKLDIYGFANLSGVWSEDGFLIGGTTLASVGNTVAVYTQNAMCMITIVSIPNVK